ncbi:MAG: hypothetical protein AAF412_13775, partial [Pseudomonadota bacterium]
GASRPWLEAEFEMGLLRYLDGKQSIMGIHVDGTIVNPWYTFALHTAANGKFDGLADRLPQSATG